MTALLKSKSKIKIQRKPRVQYEVAPTLKRMRNPQQQVTPQNLSQAQTQSQTQKPTQQKNLPAKKPDKFDFKMDGQWAQDLLALPQCLMLFLYMFIYIT